MKLVPRKDRVNLYGGCYLQSFYLDTDPRKITRAFVRWPARSITYDVLSGPGTKHDVLPDELMDLEEIASYIYVLMRLG